MRLDCILGQVKSLWRLHFFFCFATPAARVTFDGGLVFNFQLDIVRRIIVTIRLVIAGYGTIPRSFTGRARVFICKYPTETAEYSHSSRILIVFSLSDVSIGRLTEKRDGGKIFAFLLSLQLQRY